MLLQKCYLYISVHFPHVHIWFYMFSSVLTRKYKYTFFDTKRIRKAQKTLLSNQTVLQLTYTSNICFICVWCVCVCGCTTQLVGSLIPWPADQGSNPEFLAVKAWYTNHWTEMNSLQVVFQVMNTPGRWYLNQSQSSEKYCINFILHPGLQLI